MRAGQQEGCHVGRTAIHGDTDAKGENVAAVVLAVSLDKNPGAAGGDERFLDERGALGGGGLRCGGVVVVLGRFVVVLVNVGRRALGL